MATITFKANRYDRAFVQKEQAYKICLYWDRKAKLYSVDEIPHRKCKLIMLTILTLWHSGRRISELVGQPPYTRIPGLRPIDINFDTKEITYFILKKNVVREKNKQGNQKSEQTLYKERLYKQTYAITLPSNDKLLSKLKESIESFNIEPGARIFKFTRGFIYNCIREASEAQALILPAKKIIVNPGDGNNVVTNVKISPHKFRHGFSVNFIKENKDDPSALVVLQDVLCHSDLNITKTYLKFDKGHMRKLLNNAAGIENTEEEEEK